MTRDALAKSLCAQYYECAETWDEPVACDHGFGYRDADALAAGMFESVVDQDRDEYRSAARIAPVWREPQPPTLDDLRDLADEWGDDD